MKFIFALLTVSLALASCSSQQKDTSASAAAATPAPKPLPETLDAAVSSEFRTPENRQRDQYRHPAETLAFFGIKPDMTVVEISPGKGWYTEILAPFLTKSGTYIAATVPVGESEYMKKVSEAFNSWMTKNPEVKVTTTNFNPPAEVVIAPEGTADMVLTFRNVHNWMGSGSAQSAFDSFFKALKPGGVLGVVEHRGIAGKKQDPKAKSGYVTEREVIRMAEKAGFKLDAKSEINANPKDKKNYPEGVWTLPPSLRLGEKDRERYIAIGESDRMTLRFVKPTAK